MKQNGLARGTRVCELHVLLLGGKPEIPGKFHSGSEKQENLIQINLDH